MHMSAPTQSRGIVRFGIFEMDAGSGELRRQGTRIKLQEQPFQVLALLLERPGEVVSRDELRQRLWPADTFVDFGDGLNTAIKKVRDALGDSAESPQFIETLPKHGYRFIASVEPNGAAEHLPRVANGEIPIADEPAKAGRLWRFVNRGRFFIPAGVLAITIGMVLGFAVLRGRTVNAADLRVQSLAVLPLENLSGDPSQEYFADGMTDALTTNLAQISSIRVISRTSTMQYKGVHRSVGDIGRKLNADAVIEGSVVRSGGRVRITAQLIHTRSDRHLWAHSYESDLGDVLALQDEVARDVTQQIRSTLTTQEKARLTESRPVNPEAYDFYLRGRFQFYDKNREGIEAAIGLFEQAVNIDPDFALAHAYLARAYNGKAFWYEREDLHLEQIALLHLDRALALDPNMAEAHSARAAVL